MPLPRAKNLCGAKRRDGGECTQPAMFNGRCKMHGGKSPKGIGSGTFKHGRYSKSIPARLVEGFEETLADANKLELTHELAVVVARSEEILASLYSGESGAHWIRLRSEARRIQKARDEGDADAVNEHTNKLVQMIEHGAPHEERWREWLANNDLQRRLAESERRRKIEDHQMASTEEVVGLIGAVTGIILNRVPDARTRRAIGYEIDALVDGMIPIDVGEENGNGEIKRREN